MTERVETIDDMLAREIERVSGLIVIHARILKRLRKEFEDATTAEEEDRISALIETSSKAEKKCREELESAEQEMAKDARDRFAFVRLYKALCKWTMEADGIKQAP